MLVQLTDRTETHKYGNIYNIETKDKADSKMGNASVLGLLNELEKSIDFYL